VANNITNYLGPYLGTVTMFTRFQWGSIHDSTCDIIGQDHAIVAQSKLLNSIKKVTKDLDLRCDDIFNNYTPISRLSLNTDVIDLTLGDTSCNEPNGTICKRLKSVLVSAVLVSADLVSTDLVSTDLVSTDLVSTDLVSADLVSADLVAADPVAADLVSADLVSTDLVSTDLVSTDLVAADLVASNPVAADLVAADLVASNPVAADLVSTDLVSVDLVSTDPVAADLVASNPVASNPVAADLVASNPVAADLVSAYSATDLVTHTEYLGYFPVEHDYPVEIIDYAIMPRKKIRKLNSPSPVSVNMLSERLCVSVRFTDILDWLDSNGCAQSFQVAQISMILPALQYKSEFLGNLYMSYEMVYCSFHAGHETVFLTCETKETLVEMIASSGINVFGFLKTVSAWKRLVFSNCVNFAKFRKIYEIITK